MSARAMTLEEIRLTGLAALAQKLGPVGMVRFMQQGETGQGDYSEERHRLLGNQSVEQLAKLIRQRRKRR